MNRRFALPSIACAVMLGLTGCIDSSHKPNTQANDTLPQFSSGASATDVARGSLPAASGRAVAMISGNKVTGSVTFLQAGDHVTFVADFNGLPPGSTHDFFITQSGNLSPGDVDSGRRLGSLAANGSGHAHVEGIVANVSISDTNPIVKWSVVVRDNPNAVGIIKLATEQ